MKKFSLKLIIFMIPIFILIGYFEYQLSRIKNEYNVKLEDFERKLSECEVLILGSSHALLGINPLYFRCSGFNMANGSQPIYFDYKILEKYIDRMPKLKVVVSSLSYFSLDYDFFSKRFNEYWRLYYYEKFYGLAPPTKQPLDLRGYSFIALYGNKKTFLWSLKGFKIDLSQGINEFGYIGNNEGGGDPADDQLGAYRVRYHMSIMNRKNRAFNLEYLKKIINKAASKGIRTVILTTPVYRTYYDHVNADQYRSIQEDIKRVVEKSGVKYYNYFYDNRFSASDFADCDHLNIKGAKKFTLLLENDLNLK
jgi:hypothetical protein